MKILDKVRLIFSFYLTNDNLYDEINQLHLSLISKYIHRFDEVVFCLIVNDDIKTEVIQEFQKIVINMARKDVVFKIYENTNYRESYVLYNEIASQLDKLDGLTFFAHNKGISDGFGRENVKTWIAALYFYSFEVNLPLDNMSGPMVYGPLKSRGCNHKYCSAAQNIHNWTYCGTFFWIKAQQISDYMERNSIKLPRLTNRWYSEMFLGNIMPQSEAWSHDDIFMEGIDIEGYKINEILENVYGENWSYTYFKEYCLEIL